MIDHALPRMRQSRIADNLDKPASPVGFRFMADPDTLACLLLVAYPATPSPARRWAALARLVGALVADIPAEPEVSDVRADVVVARRDTGETILRIDANTGDAELLRFVRRQLEQLLRILDCTGCHRPSGSPRSANRPSAGPDRRRWARHSSACGVSPRLRHPRRLGWLP
ncbi:hypothetical protein Vau01_037580 [Virgisporangium aurantiacum]|uniref:Uncharacterized protein n=1 Tax=Virgisporangium aurantiacum TaxID=175570 RepID=A0A8J3Z4G6_9ACTN|nr:hypothetical protein Vau01_037580 [Virgisporangium aurantiacum]